MSFHNATVRHVHCDILDSTNLHARRLWAQTPRGEKKPIVVTAATQTAGIGRGGRPWISPRGGLWMSVVWPAAEPLPFYLPLPLAVGLVVLRTLHGLIHLPMQIKWPNDVLLHERKVAGVLCQGETGEGPAPAVIIGIGINANFPVGELGNNLRYPPTTLLEELKHPVDLEAFRDQLLTNLQASLRTFDRSGLDTFMSPLREHLAWKGQSVTVTDPNAPTVVGKLLDIEPNGQLVLQTEEGTRSLDVGDLQRTRRTG